MQVSEMALGFFRGDMKGRLHKLTILWPPSLLKVIRDKEPYHVDPQQSKTT